MNRNLSKIIEETRNNIRPEILCLGYLRYETLRILNPRQYQELHRRNLEGENFDDMLDKIIVDNTR